jgi:hypothetical protein
LHFEDVLDDLEELKYAVTTLVGQLGWS